MLVSRKSVLNSKVSGKSGLVKLTKYKYVKYILFCFSRTCLLSPEMFPKGDTHKQLFQLMLSMQGRGLHLLCKLVSKDIYFLLDRIWHTNTSHSKVVFCCDQPLLVGWEKVFLVDKLSQPASNHIRKAFVCLC